MAASVILQAMTSASPSTRISGVLSALRCPRAAALNAMTVVCGDEAAAAAAATEAAQAPLAGVAFGVKENIATARMRTSAGSAALADVQAPYDAAAWARLAAAGGVLVGKCNMDEFGMGSTTSTGVFGPCVNPWTPLEQPPLSPGGSSGGCAAAVAAGLCDVALGTDTGGSVRQPAALCGVLGLKPTYGLLPRHGLVAYASSLDTVGIIARCAADAALVLDVAKGPHADDPSCAKRAHPGAVPPLLGHEGDLASLDVERAARFLDDPVDLRGVTVGVPVEVHDVEVAPEVAAALADAARMLRDAGAELRDVTLPSLPRALPAYYVTASAEASSNLARYDGLRFGHRALAAPVEGGGTGSALEQLMADTRAEGFGREVVRRVLAGTLVLSKDVVDEYLGSAAVVREQLRVELHALLGGFGAHGGAPRGEVDVLLTPPAASAALPLEGQLHRAQPLQEDAFTVPASLAGVPAVAVPTGTAEATLEGARVRVPVGVQLVGGWFQEPRLLRIARAIEQRTGGLPRPPRWCAS
mmetsp:Transcript_28/g.74  ORF Transcript_28/g.74 Transcript_28/m.74 type:complete len:528 (+) Transcript_28:59-1642(+)